MKWFSMPAITGKAIFFAPLLICLTVVFIQMMRTGYQEPVADALGYADRAVIFSVTPTEKTWGNGIVVAPFYPAFLNLMMQADPAVEVALKCYAARSDGCDVGGLAAVYTVQAVVVALTVYFSFLACLFMSGKYGLSFGVMVLILAAGRLTEYTDWLITEAWAFFGFMGFVASLSYAARVRDSLWAFLLMGLGLSLSVLTRPSYLYLVYSFIIVIPLYWWIVMKGKPVATLMKTAVFIIPFLSLVIPWMFRNLYYFDVFGVSAGYGSYILSERVAYNMMSWSEYAASFIYWLPDFGDSLSKTLFDPALYQKLDFGASDGYYRYGNSVLRSTIYAAAETDKERVSLLVNDYILGDLVKHIFVTFSLALRGMWVAKYLGLIGVFFMIPAFFLYKRMTGVGPLLLFAYPFFFMVGFNAFVSVSIPRYNVPVVLLYAMAIVICGLAVFQVVKNRCLPRVA
ncbi:hypothetical protein [Kiloniella laminariae]|uniref:hypothetical protein n=1 Tax=Kiloniella laminariae TaxID=454162 RepID=UPI0012F94322|nr:hypothetical protein [Kiloniella laminariae]